MSPQVAPGSLLGEPAASRIPGQPAQIAGKPSSKDSLRNLSSGEKTSEPGERAGEAERITTKDSAVIPQKEQSEIEAILSGKIPATVSLDLQQFGYDLFRSSVSTFAPRSDSPVGPDYLIGPGDRFTIFIWGRMDQTYEVEVNRDGKISLPRVGALKVWGLTFSQLNDYLHVEFAKYYKDVRLIVTMDRLRTIRVYVVGEAVTPGSYALSSLSTVYNALFAAGGPSKKGSMRQIRLIRNGKIIRTVDLYDFLLEGDKTHDERLQSGDTVFIPVIGPVAGIAGSVKRPAIYELKDTLTLGELIQLAEGVSPVGYLQRVQVERVVAHEKRLVADFDLSSLARGEQTPSEAEVRMQDADMVKIYPIHPTTQKVVFLEGHVKRPGGYEFKEGMKVSNLLSSLNDLLPEPYLKYARLIRLMPPDFRPHITAINLENLFIEKEEAQNLSLQEHDRLIVFAQKEMREAPCVSVSGEVNRPGRYPLMGNMRLKDLVYQAGNTKRSAYLQEAEVTRLVKTHKEVASKQIRVDLMEAMKETPDHNIFLEEDDHLFVRQIPKWYLDKKIAITGEVRFPGVYTFQKGERLSSVLERAGGFTAKAYLPGAIFTRESVRKIQERRIREFVEEQEREMIKEGTRLMEGAISKDEAEQKQRALEQRRNLVNRLKAAEVSGRVVIHLVPLEKLRNSEFDLELEEGDTLQLPSVPSSVMVMGRVYNPNAILYTKDRTLRYYLEMVGGPAENADEKRIHLIKADGSVVSRTQERWFSNSFMGIPVDPGDTILVPEKYDRIYWTRETKDWSQILFQIAVAAGVAIALF